MPVDMFTRPECAKRHVKLLLDLPKKTLTIGLLITPDFHNTSATLSMQIKNNIFTIYMKIKYASVFDYVV